MGIGVAQLKPGYTREYYRRMRLTDGEITFELIQRYGQPHASINLVQIDGSRIDLCAYFNPKSESHRSEVWGYPARCLRVQPADWYRLHEHAMKLLKLEGGPRTFDTLGYHNHYYNSAGKPVKAEVALMAPL